MRDPVSEETKIVAFGVGCVTVGVGYGMAVLLMLGWSWQVVLAAVMVAEGVGWTLLLRGRGHRSDSHQPKLRYGYPAITPNREESR